MIISLRIVYCLVVCLALSGCCDPFPRPAVQIKPSDVPNVVMDRLARLDLRMRIEEVRFCEPNKARAHCKICRGW
jgi:hypothetical protein